MNSEGRDRGRATERAEATVKQLRTTPSKVRPESAEECIRVLPSHYYHCGHESGVEMSGVRGAPDWRGYEMRVWELSEVVREFLKTKRALRGRCSFFDAIADVVKDHRFGKGRQNFVLILAQYGGSSYSSTIAWALDDPEIMGHAVKALAKLREPGYSERIEEILKDSRFGWIRSAAKNYLRNVADLS